MQPLSGRRRERAEKRGSREPSSGLRHYGEGSTRAGGENKPRRTPTAKE